MWPFVTATQCQAALRLRLPVLWRGGSGICWQKPARVQRSLRPIDSSVPKRNTMVVVGAVELRLVRPGTSDAYPEVSSGGVTYVVASPGDPYEVEVRAQLDFLADGILRKASCTAPNRQLVLPRQPSKSSRPA